MGIVETSTEKLEQIPKAKTNKKKTVQKLKFKCDKCECTFRKEITLIKHKNAKPESNSFTNRHEIGRGNFCFFLDVRPGKENEAGIMTKAWTKEKLDRNENKIKDISHSEEEDTDKNKKEQTDDSEDAEAFQAKYDDDNNYIGQ